MSIVAITECLGSLGEQIGQEVAYVLGFDYGNREILTKAAEHFEVGVTDLQHVTDGRPAFRERFGEQRRRYATFVEAVVLEMAARDNVVLVGRGAAMYLQGIRHALRVRITAPAELRGERVCRQQQLTPPAALAVVRRSDRERAARVRFVHGVDWSDPLLFDLVLNTAALRITEGVSLIREALKSEQRQPTAASIAEVENRRLVALAHAALMRHPETRHVRLSISCRNGHLVVRGAVSDEALRRLVQRIVAGVPGVRGMQSELVPPGPPGLTVLGP